jgi:hypothetical protein
MSRWIVLVPLVLLLQASPAAALSWGLGSHFGIASLDIGGSGGNPTVLGWPSNALAYEPGLRVACGNEAHTRELILDSGWLLLNESGSTLSLFVGDVGYQHVVRPAWYWSPFANVGLGWYSENGVAHSHTSAKYGGGLGMRHALRDSHGAVRAEVRYDHLASDPGSGRPTLNTVALRLGFDLWF